MNGTAAVARYTLLELSRRRVLLVFFLVGSLGIIGLGVGLRILYSLFESNPNGGFNPVTNQFVELQFVSFIRSALGTFGLLIAYGIGMTAIYHDLDSGAAISIFSKPVSRFAFSVGKILAGVAALVVIVGLLAVEARLVMLLFGGGYEDAITEEVLATVANTLVVMLIVLALSTWMNNIVAAVVAFVYYNVITGVMTLLHSFVTSNLIENGVARAVIDVAYWLFPHPLTSSIPAALVRAQVQAGGQSGQSSGPAAAVLQGSGPGDIAWWAFVMVFFAAVVYYSVRRRQV